MRTRICLSAILAAWVVPLFCNGAAESNLRGDWIRPAWPDGKEPQFPNRAFCWTSASAVPNKVVVYRKDVIVRGRIRSRLTFERTRRPLMGDVIGAVRIESAGHVYVFIDGKEVYRSDRPKREHIIVLSPFLSLGEHVVMVAAGADGFAMSGFFEGVEQRSVAPIGRRVLATDSTWKAKKFPLTTILELEPCCEPSFDDSEWIPVEVVPGKTLHASTDVLIKAIWRDAVQRLCADIAEAEWRLSLISRKGIAILANITYHGWSPARINPAALAAAQEGLSWIPQVRATVGDLTKKEVNDLASFNLNRYGLYRALGLTWRLNELVEGTTDVLYLADEFKNLVNCALLVRKDNETFSIECEGLAARFRVVQDFLKKLLVQPAQRNAWLYRSRAADLRKRIEQAWGHPLNRYNESRFSIMGWIPNADLVGGELADWGLHVWETDALPVVSLPQLWRFQLDRGDEGTSQGWHTIGFNIEGQWPMIRVPGTWESGYKDVNPDAEEQNPYADEVAVSHERPYNGFAWYRSRVRVPEEWRGNDPELDISWANDWDWTYFNEQLVGKTGPETPNWTETPRRYPIPKDVVRFGEDNLIAIRVFDAGGEGGLGKVELRCPGLLAGGAAQPATVLRSFLSPGILVKTPLEEMTIWGKKEVRGSVLLPLRSGFVVRGLTGDRPAYSLSEDGKLAENWFLWSPGFSRSEPERPIEVVLEKNLVELTASEEGDRSSLRVVFAESGARVVVIRPLQARLSESGFRLSDRQVETCRFWARALLEYPLSYTEMTRLDPQNRDFVQVFDIYNYESLDNAWGLQPLRLAPAPVFLTYALRTGWPGLAVEGHLADTGFDLGKYGNCQAVLDSNIISYRYPRDKMLRLGGFTSWVFMPWDAGVPGNDRECEVIAQTGSNSYRPQHNFAGEKARTFADYCNKYGLNYMNNPDNVLGDKGGKRGENVEVWVNHYRELAKMFKDRPEYAVAYDLINEAANMRPEVYNPLIKRLTDEIRKMDPVHPIYVETCNSWGAVEQFPNLAVTGDPRTVYSFHDYNFRLRGEDRYPSLKWDIQHMYKRWMPAFDFQIKNHVRVHLGEFGGYEKGGEFNPCATTMLHDVFRIADQFNWHFNYYPGRGIAWPRADGSLRPNRVFWAFKRYFDLGYFNMYFTPEERKIIK